MKNYLCLVVQGTLIVILLCECNNFDFLLRPHSDPYMAPEENKSNLIFRFFGFFFVMTVIGVLF